MFDIVIVGGGPAGLTAAIYAERAGFRTLLLERYAQGGQMLMTSVVDNYPGFPSVFGVDLAEKLSEHAKSAGTEFVSGEATKLDLAGPVKTVHTANASYEAKAVILALGTERRKLNVPGEKEFAGHGVSYCATCDGNFFRRKTVAVIGSGNTALGDAIELARLCEKVYLVHRHAEPKAMAPLIERAHELPNLIFVPESEAARIEGGQKVERLVVKNNTTGAETEFQLSGVFVAVGVLPNSGLLQSVMSLSDGYVAAGEDCETPVPGVFVAGDLRRKEMLQIATAIADGANAVWSAQKYLRGAAV